jgi:hypothetical protein
MATTTQLTKATRPESLERHLRGLSEAVKAAEARARAAGNDARAAINEAGGEQLAGALAALEAQLARARTTDGVYALPVNGGLPAELGVHLRQAEHAAGGDERAIVVIVPRPDRHGHQERKAWAVVDVSHAVWR